MTEFNRIEDVDAFCLKLYSGDKAATLKVTSQGWRQVIDEIGLGLLLSVLHQSSSAYSIMFVSRAASECLETIFSDAEQLTQFTMTVYDLLCARDAELNAAAKLALRQLVCIAVQRGYRYSPTLARMSTSVSAACAADLAQGGPWDRVRVGCEVVADLVVTLEERRMSTFASDVGIAKTFRDEHLLDVYQMAVTVVKRVPPQSRATLSAAVRLAQRVLDFDFTCEAGVREEDEGTSVRVYPENWAAALLDVPLLDRLWTLYRIPELEPDAAQEVLEVVAALLSMQRALFTDTAARRKWYSIVLLQTHLTMERYAHLEDEETLSVFARLLNRIKPNCDIDELMQIDVFPRWTQSLSGFTRQCLANWRHARTSLLSLLSTWARLLEARSYATQDVTGLVAAGLTVARAYMDCIHSRVRVYTAELGARLSGESHSTAESPRRYPSTSAVEYALDDDVEGVRLEMDFVLKVVAGCGDAGWRLLEANAELVGSELLPRLRGPSSALSAELVVAVEESAWALRLMTAALLTDGAIEQGMCHVLAMLLHTLVQLRAMSAAAPDVLSQLPMPVRGHLASAAVQVLATVLAKTVSVYVNSNRKTSAFVEQLNTRLRLCGEMEAGGVFGVYLLNLAIGALWSIMNAANVPDTVRMEALVLLDEWTSTPSLLRLLRETASYRLLMNLESESYPEPLRHTDALAARHLFVRCVAQMRFFDAVSLTDASVMALLQPLLSRVAAARSAIGSSSGEDLLALTLCDLRGLLSSTERRPYRIVMDVMEPSLGPLTELVLWENTCQQVAVVQLLELAMELAMNKNQRIVYGLHSARPICIFRYVSHVVVQTSHLARRVLASAPAPAAGGGTTARTEWAWKVTRMALTAAHHILQGGWCNLGVLLLYRDPALTSVLEAAWDLLSGPASPELAARPAVCEAAVKMASVLANRFFHWFWAPKPAAEVAAVVHLIEACAFPDTVGGSAECPHQAVALQAVDRLVTCCYVRSAFPTEDAEQAASMKAVLLAADPLLFHRLATCALERSVAVDNHAVRRLLPLLVLVEGPSLAEVAIYFSARGTTPAASQELSAQFAVLQQLVARSPEVTNEAMGELQNAVHTLIDTLRVSL